MDASAVANGAASLSWINIISMGASTITACTALMALRAWRTNTLGQRKIKLAEDCLLLCWKLDEAINEARHPRRRFSRPYDNDPPNLVEVRENSIATSKEKLLGCLPLVEEFRTTFNLAEFYIGYFAIRTPLMKKRLSIDLPSEYENIIGGLLVTLQYIPTRIYPATTDPYDALKTRLDYYDAFFGVRSEKVEDEFTARLRTAKRALERVVRPVIRQRSLTIRLLDSAFDKAHERLYSRTKIFFTDSFEEDDFEKAMKIAMLDSVAEPTLCSGADD